MSFEVRICEGGKNPGIYNVAPLSDKFVDKLWVNSSMTPLTIASPKSTCLKTNLANLLVYHLADLNDLWDQKRLVRLGSWIVRGWHPVGWLRKKTRAWENQILTIAAIAVPGWICMFSYSKTWVSLTPNLGTTVEIKCFRDTKKSIKYVSNSRYSAHLWQN